MNKLIPIAWAVSLAAAILSTGCDRPHDVVPPPGPNPDVPEKQQKMTDNDSAQYRTQDEYAKQI